MSSAMTKQVQAAAFATYNDETVFNGPERERARIAARPAQEPVDTEAAIRRAMARFPTVRAYLAR